MFSLILVNIEQMSNLWNLKDLPLPAVSTYRATNSTDIGNWISILYFIELCFHELIEIFSLNSDFMLLIYYILDYQEILIFLPDLEELHSACEEFIKYFTECPQLYAEHLLLSRIVYRMKQKFRTSKDFKSLEKLNKALRRYFNMNISSDVQTLCDLLIPEYCRNELYLPTKNVVDYILVRLQGVAKLMEYIIGTCTETGYMLNIRLYTGHFWKIGFILFSIVARIYLLAKHCVQTVCSFYSQILPLSHTLKNPGQQFLPENYILPENLESWLDIDLTNMENEIENIQKTTKIPDIINYFNLADNSDSDVEVTDEFVCVNDDDVNVIEITDNYVFIDKEKNNHVMKKLPRNTKGLRGFSSFEDTGEVIEVLSIDKMDLDDDGIEIISDEVITESNQHNIKQSKDIKKLKNNKKKYKIKNYHKNNDFECNGQFNILSKSKKIKSKEIHKMNKIKTNKHKEKKKKLCNKNKKKTKVSS